MGCTVARARGGVVPTLGITAAKVSRGAPHPGYHRPRRGPGCGYHIDQARGLARGGNTLYPKIPVPEIGYVLSVKNVLPEHRSGPSRSDVWRTNLAYRINYTSDGMDSKSQLSRSHTHSRIKKYRYQRITPGKIPRVSQSEGAGPGCGAPRVSRQRSLSPGASITVMPGVGTTPPPHAPPARATVHLTCNQGRRILVRRFRIANKKVKSKVI